MQYQGYFLKIALGTRLNHLLIVLVAEFSLQAKRIYVLSEKCVGVDHERLIKTVGDVR